MVGSVIQGAFPGVAGDLAANPFLRSDAGVGPPVIIGSRWQAAAGAAPFAIRPSRPARSATTVQRLANGAAVRLPAKFGSFGGGGGKRMPDPVRQKMEAALAADFSDVRIHVGREAPSIGALAFAHGSNIYFAPGLYDPHTPRGQQLLGHELAHVLQQRAGRVRNPFGAGIAVVQDHGLEAEADRLGRQAAAHRPDTPGVRPPGRPAVAAPRQHGVALQGMFAGAAAVAAIAATEAGGYGFGQAFLTSTGRSAADIQALRQHVYILTALRLARLRGRALPFLIVLARAIEGGAPRDRVLEFAAVNGITTPQRVIGLANSPADLAQIGRIGAANVPHLLTLYGDGATHDQVTTLLGRHNDGVVLHAQIQALAGGNVAHLVQLYGDGASHAQITTLLGYHDDGAALHAQIQTIAGRNVDHLLQLYGDGATPGQITALLAHHNDGAVLRAQIGAIKGHNVGHLLQLYSDGATHGDVTALLRHHKKGNVLHAQIRAIANRSVADLRQLYADGATAAQITALLGENDDGAVLHAQIQAIVGRNVAHLIQLYGDQASSDEITALLGCHSDGAVLHAQLQTILNNDVAALLQVYVDGATHDQITALLAAHNDGATLHAQIQRMTGRNVAHLILLYADGASHAEITTLQGYYGNGGVLHAQLQAIAHHNAAQLIDLYHDGARHAQITTLLGRHNDGAILHAQIQAIANRNVAHLLRLYADGATHAEITALLGHHNDGAALHAQIQSIDNNNVASLIQLYGDGATHGEVTALLAQNSDGVQLHVEIGCVVGRGLTIADLVTIGGIFTAPQVWDVVHRNPPLAILQLLLAGNPRTLPNLRTWLAWAGAVRVHCQYNNAEAAGWGIGFNFYLRRLDITWFWHAHYLRDGVGRPTGIAAGGNGSHFKVGHSRLAQQYLGGSSDVDALTMLQWASGRFGGSLPQMANVQVP